MLDWWTRMHAKPGLAWPWTPVLQPKVDPLGLGHTRPKVDLAHCLQENALGQFHEPFGVSMKLGPCCLIGYHLSRDKSI